MRRLKNRRPSLAGLAPGAATSPTTLPSLFIELENLPPLSGCSGQHRNVRKAAAPDNTGMRINLKTPFAEKDEAKALGARWDPKKKCWYIQNVADLTPFARWITDSPSSASPEKSKGAVVTGGPVSAGCGCEVLPWEDCEHSSAPRKKGLEKA